MARKYWFVETKRTRDLQCVSNIIKACGLKENAVKTTFVEPEALTFHPPDDWLLPPDTTFYLNLTAATKPMMLSVYRYYGSLPNARCYYIPIGGAEALPVQGQWPAIGLPQLNFKDYLLALGFTFTYNIPNESLQQKAGSLFTEVIRLGNAGKVYAIQNAKAEHYKKPDKKWLCGEWWEDYLYATIKKDLNLSSYQIAQGVQLEHCLSKSITDSDNELDVVFVYQNRLFAVEGKVYTGKAGGDKITTPIYKLGTIIKTLGLQANGIICLCANITASQGQLSRIDYLKRISGVKIFLTLKEFKEKYNFINIIK